MSTFGSTGLRRVAVFCGSSAGARREYEGAAAALGRALGRRGVGLVYGGADVGLMGVLADAALDAGAAVVGVIPKALVEREVAHRGLDDLRIVGSMHERKALMADLADAFVALPGGLGTLEELFEVLTWSQLGLHRKPCGLLNAAGFFDPLLEMLAHCRDQGFVRAEHLPLCRADAEALLDALAVAHPPAGRRWIERDET